MPKEQRMESRTAASEEVRDFYERMPYPAPLTNLDEHRVLYSNPERRRALFHLIFPTKLPHPDQEILIAGCGTSQAARYALREPDARITAIDVSATSLRYTRELKQKYRLDNLELHQLSILGVQSLGKTFDQIVCTGVLHHLADPDVGLESLRNVLKPDGAMHIMVYAKYGRSGIYMMQTYCRLLGITPSDQELLDLREALTGLPEDHPLEHLLRHGMDFQHPDALADALLHPRDHAFTVPQVYEWLERCGMSFGRWFEQAPYIPRCGVLARTPHAARLNALPETTQYAAAELFRGTMTQHSFIAYRDDRSIESQPIQFTGERWRNYVPIRLPWTACIRDRVPPGNAAVLLNRAHRHPDLVLPITAAENRLLNSIDGTRTLAEIVQDHGEDRLRALQFFQQLWQYDQIVFDASRNGAAV
jgi:2-polyprenyl-3-methyl-5-hydroxy-6-metoxy-1,4-benzoquinol methylase